MTGRDRIVLMVLVVLALAAGGWILLVSPERKEVKKYDEQVSSAQAELSTAQSQLVNAKAAESQYATAYADVVNLGKAVPASQEVASLVYQLEQVSNERNVGFNSIVSATSTTSSSSSSTSTPTPSAGASASTTATASLPSASFTDMPFTFIFNGNFFSLEKLFRGLTSFTTHGNDGTLDVSGRLLTIQSVKLAPEAGGSTSNPKLIGTVTATAYVLPASQGLTAGATPTSPTGATTPAATSSPASSTTAPAVARVTP